MAAHQPPQLAARPGDILPAISKSVSSDPGTQRAVLWGLTAATAFAAGAAFWWLTREKYYSYVPPQVRRPAAGS